MFAVTTSTLYRDLAIAQYGLSEPVLHNSTKIWKNHSMPEMTCGDSNYPDFNGPAHCKSGRQHSGKSDSTTPVSKDTDANEPRSLAANDGDHIVNEKPPDEWFTLRYRPRVTSARNPRIPVGNPVPANVPAVIRFPIPRSSKERLRERGPHHATARSERTGPENGKAERRPGKVGTNRPSWPSKRA